MSEESKKKRQHYVPRFILRKFSADDRNVGIMVLATDTRVERGPLAQQCYKDYYYGANGQIEKVFTCWENAFSKALDDLSVSHLEALKPEEINQVLLFTHYQSLRPVAAAEYIGNFSEDFSKIILEDFAKSNDIDLDTVSIRLEEPQYLLLYFAAFSSILSSDLEVKFLVSDKGLGLVLSDNPVTAYNQWAEHHPVFANNKGNNGLASRGFQQFLPLSPHICLATFDPKTYAYGSNQKRTCKIGLQDVRLLNTLQVLNANKCIYYDSRFTPSKELTRLQENRAHFSLYKKPETDKGPTMDSPNGKSVQFIRFTKNSLKIGRKLSCIRVIDHSSYDDNDGTSVPIRSPKLMEDMEKIKNEWTAIREAEATAEESKKTTNGLLSHKE